MLKGGSLKGQERQLLHFVSMGQTVAEMWPFFDLSKMAAVCHLAFVNCDVRVSTTHEGHFVVFITVQNLVG